MPSVAVQPACIGVLCLYKRTLDFVWILFSRYIFTVSASSLLVYYTMPAYISHLYRTLTTNISDDSIRLPAIPTKRSICKPHLLIYLCCILYLTIKKLGRFASKCLAFTLWSYYIVHINDSIDPFPYSNIDFDTYTCKYRHCARICYTISFSYKAAVFAIYLACETLANYIIVPQARDLAVPIHLGYL